MKQSCSSSKLVQSHFMTLSARRMMVLLDPCGRGMRSTLCCIGKRCWRWVAPTWPSSLSTRLGEMKPLLPLYLQSPTNFSIECICSEYFECKKASGTTNECKWLAKWNFVDAFCIIIRPPNYGKRTVLRHAVCCNLPFSVCCLVCNCNANIHKENKGSKTLRVWWSMPFNRLVANC